MKARYYNNKIFIEEDGLTVDIDDFTKYLFNIFNGRINICNPAVLRIKHIPHYCYREAYGTAVYPNIITIYACTMIMDGLAFKVILTQILQSIIHELYHIDQFINNKIYTTQYNHEIEFAVEFMTYTYIRSNWNILIDILNHYLSCEYFTEKDFYFDSYNYDIYMTSDINLCYNRKDLPDQILLGILNATGTTELTDKLSEYLRDNKSEVFYTINDQELLVKTISDGSPIYINLSEYNKFIYDNMYKYNTNMDISLTKSGDLCHVKVDFTNRVTNIVHLCKQ